MLMVGAVVLLNSTKMLMVGAFVVFHELSCISTGLICPERV